MSTVDLSQAKAGDVVHFRCGGSAVISSIVIKQSSMRDSGTCPDWVRMQFDNSRLVRDWGVNGQWVLLDNKDPFDIIKVESK